MLRARYNTPPGPAQSGPTRRPRWAPLSASSKGGQKRAESRRRSRAMSHVLPVQSCVCLYIFIHTHICIYLHLLLLLRMYMQTIDAYTYMSTYKLHMCKYKYLHINASLHLPQHTHLQSHTRTYIHIDMCMHIYIM